MRLRSLKQVLSKIMDYTIEEMDTLRSANEQKRADITRIDGQLQKALEVNRTGKHRTSRLFLACRRSSAPWTSKNNSRRISTGR